MYYEINVSKNGQHYFATAERSITTKKKAAELTVEFMQKFPHTDGYEISVSENHHSGKYIPLQELMLAATGG